MKTVPEISKKKFFNFRKNSNSNSNSSNSTSVKVTCFEKLCHSK